MEFKGPMNSDGEHINPLPLSTSPALKTYNRHLISGLRASGGSVNSKVTPDMKEISVRREKHKSHEEFITTPIIVTIKKKKGVITTSTMKLPNFGRGLFSHW